MERDSNGRFKKATTSKVKLTKVTVSAPFEFARKVVHETYLTGSELDVFKLRMRNQYAGDFGIDPARVEVK